MTERFQVVLDDQAVIVPGEVLDALGGGGRIPVPASFDGVAYRGSVERDDAERTVDVPEDLAAALDAAGVRAGFDALSYTKRKERVRTITVAKKPETRASRVAKAVDAART